MITGVDLSHHNGDVQFHDLKAAGVEFVYAKATEGTGMVDPMFATYRERAKAVGIHFGAYHFFHFDESWGDQAHLFAHVVGTVLPGDLPPALDLEQDSYRNGQTGVSVATGAERALAWLNTMKVKLNIKPVVYCDPDFAKHFLQNKEFGGYSLWLASYQDKTPATPTAWKAYTLWQYSEHGQLANTPGEYDLDKFQMTTAAFSAFLQK